MEFKDKIMLYCFGEVKCNQGFTKGIWYDLYKALGVTISMWISGLMVSELDFRDGYLGSFPGKQNYKFTFQFFFEDSNEETIGREQKEEVLWWNVGKYQ